MMHRDSKSGDRPWAAIRYFLAIFVSLTGLLFIVLWIHYQAEARSDRAARNAAEELNVGLVKGVITNDLQLAVSDLMFLSEHDELRATLASTSGTSPKRLAGQILLFGQKRKVYEQIRLLDRTGKEIVSAELGDGQGRTAANSELQDLSGRPDFQQIVSLQAGQIYMSTIEKEALPGQAPPPPCWSRSGPRYLMARDANRVPCSWSAATTSYPRISPRPRAASRATSCCSTAKVCG